MSDTYRRYRAIKQGIMQFYQPRPRGWIMSYLWRVIRYTFLVFILVSCNRTQPTKPTLIPPATFRDSDIIGRWEVFNANGYSEVLVLNADSSFTQTFKVPEKSLQIERSGTWRLEHRASGCIYLHLEGMYYFYGGLEVADNGNRFPDGDLYRFQELCENQPITMPDKVILSVIEFPRFPRNIALLFPLSSLETSSVRMRLQEIEMVPTP